MTNKTQIVEFAAFIFCCICSFNFLIFSSFQFNYFLNLADLNHDINISESYMTAEMYKEIGFDSLSHNFDVTCEMNEKLNLDEGILYKFEHNNWGMFLAKMKSPLLREDCIVFIRVPISIFKDINFDDSVENYFKDVELMFKVKIGSSLIITLLCVVFILRHKK